MLYEDFLAKLSAPARRGLETEGITDFKKLATFSEKELLSIHGFGPKSIPVVRQWLALVEMNLK